MIELGENRYGKSAIRLVRVVRGAGGQRVRDLTVAVSLEGAFETAHTEGDNSGVIATDTMKNTTYAFAKDHLEGSIENFGRRLAEHFREQPQVARATVTVREHAWRPIPTRGGVAVSPDAFIRDASSTRLAIVTAGDGGTRFTSGIEELAMMKTTKSAFVGFPRDRFTTLREATDRLMATQVSARWHYGRSSDESDFDRCFEAITETLLEAFAEHSSPSVQASIWIIGRAILEAHAEVTEVSLSMPNLHHWLVDLEPFGLANEGEIFMPTREPHGLIEATIRRRG